MINAKVILDSVSKTNVRLITMELHYPRYIHGQVMTHRVFSRNGASSRAIPVSRVIKNLKDTPVVPTYWGKNGPGMQPTEVLPLALQEEAIEIWKEAERRAIAWAEELSNLGVHKQTVNRLLEPFQTMKLIVTATEWDNFFNLRLCDESVQAEMNQLATAMREAIRDSDPEYRKYHLPYALHEAEHLADKIRTSVAGCARGSYDMHDSSTRTVEKDIKLHGELLNDCHFSPFEHQAKASGGVFGITHTSRRGVRWSNNFREWMQYRAIIQQGGSF